jgi:zinc protease
MSARLGLVPWLVLLGCGGMPPLPPAPPAPAPAAWIPMTPAPAPDATTPDAPFRLQPPAAAAPIAWTAPVVTELRLKNGLRVLFVERHDLPVVAVEVVERVGAGDLPGLRPGVASFMGSMLEQGTDKRNALEISDAYEALGAQHSAWVGEDSGGASVVVLKAKLEAALDLLSDVVERPSFPEAEIDRSRTRRLATLQEQRTSAGAMAENAVLASVYGRAHPYGHSSLGVEADAKKLARDEIVAAYRREFTPANATLVAAGDVTKAELLAALEPRFGEWKAGAGERGRVPPVAPLKPGGARIELVDQPGAPQTQVLLAEPGIPFAHPDRDAVRVMNTILGGMFSSRINLNLREAHAYTYGARSRFSLRHGAGPFTAGGAIFAGKSLEAIGELMKEVRRMRDEPVTGEELALAKDNVKLALPAKFETVGDVAGAVADLAVYGLPLDYYATLGARIDAVTAADVQRVAKERLHPDAMRIVVVGDRAKLESGLAGLGLGAIEVRDPYGDTK